MSTQYLGTSTGLRLRHAQPTGSVQLNAKSGDRARSAWAGVPTADFADVDVVAVGQEQGQRQQANALRRVSFTPAGLMGMMLAGVVVSLAGPAIALAWTRSRSRPAPSCSAFWAVPPPTGRCATRPRQCTIYTRAGESSCATSGWG